MTVQPSTVTCWGINPPIPRVVGTAEERIDGFPTQLPLALLRPVAPSQGKMLEALRADLDAHRGSPDKVPERRLATLDAAGRLSIPFTTGILVGIGESREDRLAAHQTSHSSGVIEVRPGHRCQPSVRSIR